MPRSAGAVSVLSVHCPTVAGTRRGGVIREGAPIGGRRCGMSRNSPTAVGARNPPVRGALRILDSDGSPPGTSFARLDHRGQEARNDNTKLNRSVHLTNRTTSEEKRLQQGQNSGVAGVQELQNGQLVRAGVFHMEDTEKLWWHDGTRVSPFGV